VFFLVLVTTTVVPVAISVVAVAISIVAVAIPVWVHTITAGVAWAGPDG
jgi:hypothetical protein